MNKTRQTRRIGVRPCAPVSQRGAARRGGDFTRANRRGRESANRSDTVGLAIVPGAGWDTRRRRGFVPVDQGLRAPKRRRVAGFLDWKRGEDPLNSDRGIPSLNVPQLDADTGDFDVVSVAGTVIDGRRRFAYHRHLLGDAQTPRQPSASQMIRACAPRACHRLGLLSRQNSTPSETTTVESSSGFRT